jgi:hypothetical protein
MSAFLAEAETYRKPVPGNDVVHVGRRRVEELAGLALLRINLAWESLLEDTFVRYMCGAVSPSGYKPILLGARRRSIGSATALVLGGSRYVSWSRAATVQRASVHFDSGDPYATALAGARATLEDMATVRNRIAHASDYAAAEFAAVVRRRVGYVPRGMTTGRFLLTPIAYPGGGGLRFVDLYINTLLASAAVVVP